jgi:hypothetical protein
MEILLNSRSLFGLGWCLVVHLSLSTCIILRHITLIRSLGTESPPSRREKASSSSLLLVYPLKRHGMHQSPQESSVIAITLLTYLHEYLP